MVGRIHTRGPHPLTSDGVPVAWGYYSVGASIVPESEGDYVVTCDGTKHEVTE